MSTTVSRTAGHTHMRPVVRPLPRPGVSLSTGKSW